MGRPAQKVRVEPDFESSDPGGAALEDEEVLDLLELPKSQNDVFDPAIGLGYGVVFGAALWAVIIAIYLLVS